MLLFSGFNPAQNSEEINAHIKATFIYNFTRYIEWPAESKKGNFVIGIFGTTPLFAELNKMKQKTTRGNQPFEIKTYSSVSVIGNCHIIFISKEKSGEIPEVVKMLKDKNTLIISEKDGLIEKGADINFVIFNNKQGFEINRTNISDHGLSMASSLTSFATKVI